MAKITVPRKYRILLKGFNTLFYYTKGYSLGDSFVPVFTGKPTPARVATRVTPIRFKSR